MQRIKLLPITYWTYTLPGMFAPGLFSLFGFPLIRDPCCKVSSCFAGTCWIHSMTLSSQRCFSGLQGLPGSWELWMSLKVRLRSLWLLSSVASTALENKLILTGTISSENVRGGVWEFSSLHKSVLSHFSFDGCWFNLTCFITWWSCGSAGF